MGNISNIPAEKLFTDRSTANFKNMAMGVFKSCENLLYRFLKVKIDLKIYCAFTLNFPISLSQLSSQKVSMSTYNKNKSCN